MDQNRHFYTFIIASKRETDVLLCLQSLKKLSKGHSYEVLLAVGTNPSYQRNMAAKQAKGDILIFLDDDSVVSPFLLDHYQFVFSNYPQVDCVGGPSCFMSTTHPLETAINLVFTSDFGLGPVKARYVSTGEIRPAGERELILCNLAVKKSVFEEVGGLNTGLYPNEENALLNRLSQYFVIYYHPLAVVYRGHRRSVLQFIGQMLGYGSSRIRHYKLYSEFFDQLFMLPLLFFSYIVALFVIGLAGKASMGAFIPLFIYLLLIVASSLVGALTLKNHVSFFLSPFIFFLCHFFYGMGEFLEILGLFPTQEKVQSCRIIGHSSPLVSEEV